MSRGFSPWTLIVGTPGLCAGLFAAGLAIGLSAAMAADLPLVSASGATAPVPASAASAAPPLTSGASERAAWRSQGLAKIARGQREAGLRDLENFLSHSAAVDAVPEQIDALREYGAALVRAGHAAAALTLYHRERELQEAFTAKERQRVMDELHANNDRAAQRQRMALLAQDNALKNAELETHLVQQRLWALGALMGMAAAAIVVVLYRRLRRVNRELAARHGELRDLSQRDPLTGLSNRSHFEELMRRVQSARPIDGTDSLQPLEEADAPSSALEPWTGAMLLIDIDHFKRVNDQHGHDIGDRVLITVAQRLTANMLPENVLVRWGGEEFLVYAPDLDEAGARALSQRLLDAVGGTPMAVQEGSAALSVTISIGWICLPLPPHGVHTDWEQAVRLADVALYAAKGSGRNRAIGLVSIDARDAQALRALTLEAGTLLQSPLVRTVTLLGATDAAAAQGAQRSPCSEEADLDPPPGAR